MLPKIFRALIQFFVFRKATYYVGMVLVRLSRKIRSRSKEPKMVVIPNFMGNIKMKVDSNGYMGGEIYWCGFHHLNELMFLRSYLKPDMVFIDIGANQGEFSLFAASILSNGEVLAFEPTSYQLSLLRENKSFNQFEKLKIYSFGLFDKKEKMNVYTSSELTSHGGKNEGLSSIFQSESRPEVEEEIELRVFDDEFYDKLDRLDIIKIDVEGAELFVLRGMVKTLNKFKPPIIIEMNNSTFQTAGYSNNDILKFLSELGYEPYILRRGVLSSEPIADINISDNLIFRAK